MALAWARALVLRKIFKNGQAGQSLTPIAHFWSLLLFRSLNPKTGRKAAASPSWTLFCPNWHALLFLNQIGFPIWAALGAWARSQSGLDLALSLLYAAILMKSQSEPERERMARERQIGCNYINCLSAFSGRARSLSPLTQTDSPTLARRGRGSLNLSYWRANWRQHK